MIRNKAVLFAITGVLCLSIATPVLAHRYSRRDDGHILRLVAFVVHPIGIATEYVIARPIHQFVSQPNHDIVFGHKAYIEDDQYFSEWVHGDYEPSIADQIAAREEATRGLAVD